MIPIPFPMIATKLLVGAGVILFVFGAGWHYGAKGERIERDHERAQQVEATLTRERELRRSIDSITVASQKVEQDAQSKINRLQSRMRDDVRLSVRTAKCQAGDSSAGDSEGRAELLPSVAIDLVALAGDADRVVRRLNECVDKYNSLR